MRAMLKWIFIFAFVTSAIYINEIMKMPGNSLVEKYHNLSAHSDMLVDKVKKGEL